MLSNFREIMLKIIGKRGKRFLRKLTHPMILDDQYRNRIGRYVDIADHDDSRESNAPHAMLRLYAHALDKSLQRKDWEAGHSSDVYNKVKQLLNSLGDEMDTTTIWASKIVEEFETQQNQQKDSLNDKNNEFNSPINAINFLNFLGFRRSCRRLKTTEVPISHVETIAKAAIEAPCSCSRQALKIYFTNNSSMAEEILKCFNGFTGFSRVIPCAFVFCVDLRPYMMPQEIFVPTLDVGLAAQNASLMAASLSLSMTFLSWGTRSPEQENRLRNLLRAPEYMEIVVGAACGFPEIVAPRPARLGIGEILERV